MADNAVTAVQPQTIATMELGTILKIPAVRQVTLLVGVAAAVAFGVAAFLWAQGPNLTPVYRGLDSSDASDVIAALTSAGISAELGEQGSSVLVPAGLVDQARLELAGAGLPAGSNVGLELLNEQSSFGVSQFMETARYQHALEAELARTIRNLRSVQDARVHLAIPRQSSFVRNRDKPSASVMLSLNRGRQLTSAQTESIVHLVASSISNLNANAVTLIDQHGNLLSGNREENAMGMSSRQFDYARNMENLYRQKVLDLLTPVIGAGRVRAEVVADIDFTLTEETRESYDPENNAIRSEVLNEKLRQGGGPDGQGIPGALSNQPPETGGVASEGAQIAAQGIPVDRSTSTTRNFEVDKTVSIRRQPAGSIRRLSIAVLIDDTQDPGTAAEDAAADSGAQPGLQPAGVRAAVSPEMLEQYTALIKEAIGFDQARGDSVSVIAAPFMAEPPMAEAEEVPIWKQPAMLNLARNVVGILVVLGIGFGLGKPLLSGLLATTNSGSSTSDAKVATATGEVLPAGSPAPGSMMPATQLFTYDQKIAAARNITGHDPARVAQVLKKWVTNDE